MTRSTVQNKNAASNRRKPKRARGVSLQVYLSDREIAALKNIAERRACSNSELVRTWIEAAEKRYAGQIRSAKQRRRTANSPPPPPEREAVDPRQLSISGAV